jgi:AraC-like DNA-binding protein
VLTQWDRIRVTERMVEHIEKHLTEPITLAALASVARYSPFHAARMFKAVTGLAPFEYIRKRRLSAAAARLRETPTKVIDVAFDFLFDSHAGFTRAFARQFGFPPSRFRRSGADAELFMPPRLSDWYARRQRGEITMAESSRVETVFVQVVERPARRLILKRGVAATHYFEYCTEVGCDVPEALSTVKGALQEPMGLWLPDAMVPEGTSRYVMGVEVPADYSGPVPAGFEIVDLPPCRYLVFQGSPFPDSEFERAVTSLWDAMNAYRPETYGYRWADDDGPRFQFSPEGYRGAIEGRPVRPVNASAR